MIVGNVGRKKKKRIGHEAASRMENFVKTCKGEKRKSTIKVFLHTNRRHIKGYSEL